MVGPAAKNRQSEFPADPGIPAPSEEVM